MKTHAFLALTIFWLAIMVNLTSAGEAGSDNRKMVTATDLLVRKNLAPFQPACTISGTGSGLITAEDLLRIKGLADFNPSTTTKSQDEDIWGLEEDFGC